MTKESFEALLEANGSSAAIEIPLDVTGLFGQKRPPVRGTINGAPFRSTIAVYEGHFYLGVNRQLWEAAGIAPGEKVIVELERDDEPRIVEVPEDLGAALDADPEVRAFFDGLSFTHRREYVGWITEAKREETRQRRITKTLSMLRKGTKHP